MTSVQSVWIEYEEEADQNSGERDFFNVVAVLNDGSSYALNVWTAAYLVECCARGAEFVLPPDLVVRSPDRVDLVRVINRLAEEHALPAHCQLPPRAGDVPRR